MKTANAKSPTTTPFKTADEAWFWCNCPAPQPHIARPCGRMDILKVIEGLYRHRRLSMDHVRVMIFYGARQSRPNPARFQERRAFYVWREAMRILSIALEQKGWVHDRVQRALIDFSLERAQKVSA